jgi:hypothetical protein
MRRRVSAMRFASDTCRRAGTKGWNVVIFPAAIVTPGRLRILGKAGASLEELPPHAVPTRSTFQRARVDDNRRSCAIVDNLNIF